MISNLKGNREVKRDFCIVLAIKLTKNGHGYLPGIALSGAQHANNINPATQRRMKDSDDR